METVNVAETFVSIQGESSYAGMPCFFIRLAGCNLHCGYCDTPAAHMPGSPAGIPDLVKEAAAAAMPLVEITGGEPLAQPGFRKLAESLCASPGVRVLVETNGSMDISAIPADAVAIVDVKCPDSGEGGSFDQSNWPRLRTSDEIKFVISGRSDYEWARGFLREHEKDPSGRTVFFSPVHGVLDPADLAGWIIKDALAVRLGIQLHKFLRVK